ncbi:hypothetical protein [Streptomyces sp. RerS4]|uniref:hypothetical protein n=1 Tax=Streptomyces sp. RerS4 TaxID=2942449 RepID=UPI00201C6481|nr:hypothetical protein [Streptomyces sp. RerS4]UQW99267.1 hypothetical protein M4D82_00995 [Streptomyces sp. RerS4]
MTDRGEPGAGDEDEALPELCDLCGAVVAGSTELYAVVPESSAVHSVDPRLDGKRMVVGCSREHLAELVEQYKNRPFIDAELWAGKVGVKVGTGTGRRMDVGRNRADPLAERAVLERWHVLQEVSSTAPAASPPQAHQHAVCLVEDAGHTPLYAAGSAPVRELSHRAVRDWSTCSPER